MSVSATEATPGGMMNPLAGASSSQPSADKNLFLQLLVAQLRYQDPMNPSDSAEFLSQTAQFNSLEKLSDVAEATSMLLSTQMAFGASSLVGRTVSYQREDGTPATGVVQGVTFGTNGPVLDVDGTEVPLLEVLTVTAGTPAP